MSAFHLREVDNRLKGRLALVTGASGGIGAACAKALAEAGCDVALHYSSTAATAEALSEALSQQYSEQTFATFRADFSSTSTTRSLINDVLGHPKIVGKHEAVSILVANAGLGRRIRDPANIEEGDWDAMMQVNAKSPFVVIKACSKGMREQKWGRIILIGSIASKGGGMNGCHYAAAKGALTSMGLNLATVLAPENITVNIVSPAMIGSTGMVPAAKSRMLKSTVDPSDPSASANAMTSVAAEEDPGLAIASTIPVGRLGEPEEIANAVLMFAKTGYVTGQDFVLSGGLK